MFIRPLKDACSLFLLFSNCSYFDIDLIAETCQPSESVPDQAISSLCMRGLLNAWVAVQFVPFVIDYRIVLLLHSTNIGMITRNNVNYVSFLFHHGQQSACMEVFALDDLFLGTIKPTL